MGKTTKMAEADAVFLRPNERIAEFHPQNERSKVMEENRGIHIDVEEYARLVRIDMLLDMLLDALFESARLTWNKDEISFNGDYIRVLVKLISPTSYKKRLTELQEEEMREE